MHAPQIPAVVAAAGRSNSLTPVVRAALGLALVLVAACGGHPLPDPLVTVPSELPAVAGGGLDETFLAECRVEYYGRKEARKGKMTILAAPPGQLRMDVLSFTDDLISVLAVKGGRFTWFERGQKECFNGPFCAAPMVSRFPMISDPDTLLQVLVGKVPLLPEPDEQTLEFSRKQGLYVLTSRQGGTVQTVKVRPDGSRVVEATLKQDGKTVLQLLYEGEMQSGERRLPRTIRLLAPQEGLDLSIEYREVELGYTFQSDPFVFECPKGVETLELNCLQEVRHGE